LHPQLTHAAAADDDGDDADAAVAAAVYQMHETRCLHEFFSEVWSVSAGIDPHLGSIMGE
jgi:hypothetical protein